MPSFLLLFSKCSAFKNVYLKILDVLYLKPCHRMFIWISSNWKWQQYYTIVHYLISLYLHQVCLAPGHSEDLCYLLLSFYFEKANDSRQEPHSSFGPVGSRNMSIYSIQLVPQINVGFKVSFSPASSDLKYFPNL